ncbi:MAG: TlpA disulfide reductase family protein [Chloroflexi bacterium]|nr:TlpA disulfide reductase family protein [Chloroflexota bacterium]
MSNPHRLLHLLAALLSLGAALALLRHAGLPDRADYTGIRGSDGSAVAPEIGARAPDFTLLTTRAEPLALQQMRGATTIINFWATWCQPCHREMLALQRLYEIEDGELRILALNLGESAETARNWVSQLGLTYDVLLDSGEHVARLYQVRGLPATYLLDAAQRIQRVYYGALRTEQLRADVTRLGRKA